MGIRSGYHPLTELLVVCLQQDPVALPHCLFSLQCKASCPAHCRHLINLCTFAQRLRDWNNGLKLPPSFKFHWHVHDSFSSRICSCCSFLGGGVCWWTLRDDYVRQREDCSHPGILSSATLGDSLGLCCTPGSLIQYSISRVPWKCRVFSKSVVSEVFHTQIKCCEVLCTESTGSYSISLSWKDLI